jgi:hypothetical protein
MKESRSMFVKKSVIATAIVAGLVSGIALADEHSAPAAGHDSKVEKKNECKGHKDECKGKKAHKKHKKGEKDACSGPNGCDGKEAKAADHHE